MSQANKRRVAVASFTMADVARFHKVLVIVAVILILISGALAWVATDNARTAGEAKVLAAQVSAAAEEAERATKNYPFGAGRLSVLIQEASKTDRSLDRLTGAAGIIPGLSSKVADTAVAWKQVSNSLMVVWQKVKPAADASDRLMGQSGQLNKLAREFEQSGRTTGAWSRHYEAVNRLIMAADNGFSPAASARISSDLTFLSNALADTEFRGYMEFATTVIPALRLASAKPATTQEMDNLLKAAGDLKNAGDRLTAQASNTVLQNLLLAVALALALLAIGICYRVVSLVVADVGKRYIAALQKFRVNEDDYKEVVEKLKFVLANEQTSISVKNSNTEFTEIVGIVNQILEHWARRVADTVDIMEGAHANTYDANIQVGTVMSRLEGLIDGLSETSRKISSAVKIAETMSMDAHAVQKASDVSSEHSVSATSTSKEASTRMAGLREGLQETNKGIKRLGEKAQEIEILVQELDALNEQYSVIAMNATLEGERAGEAGFGFRIVAKELQSLATKTQQLFERMTSVVTGFRMEARATNDSAEKATSQVISGSNLSLVANSLLSAIAPISNEIGGIAKSIYQDGNKSTEMLNQAADLASAASLEAKSSLAGLKYLREPMEAASRALAPVKL